MADGTRLKITLVASGIGQTKRQQRTLRGLGLRRLGGSASVPDTPAVRGMITKVGHLVKVES